MKATTLRTFVLAVFSVACMTAVIIVLGESAVFIHYALAVAGIVTAVAGRSAVQSLASGGGVQGAKDVLMTSSKPPE